MERRCKVLIGGDLPWLKRILGISTHSAVGSILNQGVWNPRTGLYEGCEEVRTRDTDATSHAQFTQGTPSLKAAGCSAPAQLDVHNRLDCVPCILHCMMAVGRAYCAFINRLAA